MTTSQQRTLPGIHADVVSAIGETPLVRLPESFGGPPGREVLLKLEFTNPGGSVKDRIAAHMVDEALAEGWIAPGGTVIEATSGNTGAGLAMVCSARELKLIITMPDKMSQEKVDLLRACGATVLLTPTSVAPDDPRSHYSVAERLERELDGAWYSRQFFNQSNPEAHYRSTGPELLRQCEGTIDAFVAGIGTGGTVTGVSRYLREQGLKTRIVAVDPVGSGYAHAFATGEIGPIAPYRVEGVGEDMIPDSIDFAAIDHVEVVEDEESFEVARRLARTTGIFAGGSAGMALVAGLREAERLPEGSRVVVLLPDSGSRYLSKCFSEDWMVDCGWLPTPGERATVGSLLRDRPVGQVAPEDGLDAVLFQIADRRVRPLAVIEGDELLGVIDEAALRRAMLEGNGDATARDLLTEPVLLEHSAPVADLLDALERTDAVLVRREDGSYATLDAADTLRSLNRLP